MTTEERFWAKVDPCRTDGCALWMGATGKNGYWREYRAKRVAEGRPPRARAAIAS